jgi:hypothetical protein
MLVITTLLLIYFYSRKNPNLLDPLFGELSSTRKRLWFDNNYYWCLAIFLTYLALCYNSGSIPFARLVSVLPGFLYTLLRRMLSVLNVVNEELIGIPFGAKELWQGASVREPEGPEFMPHRGETLTVAPSPLPWLDDLLALVVGVGFAKLEDLCMLVVGVVLAWQMG